MPTWTEITRAVFGAWRLARFDSGGMNYFDLSIRGFWRSFGAAVVVLPVYIYFVAVNFHGTDASTAWFVIVKALNYGAAWAVFPILMVGLARILSLTENYVPFIVASNWASVLQVLLFIPVNTFAAFGGLESGGVALFYLLTLTMVLVYQWFVARTALQTTRAIAGGLVAVDLVLGLFVAGVFDRLV
ncbi:MAG: hypothetical protein IID55_14400 [Proteobacteria bacterium]|nr:hypothetical protein [Pseudomonadota bacterium]